MTKSVTLSDAWLEIGVGPMMIEAKRENNTRLHFANVAPADQDTDAFHTLDGPDAISYGGSGKCFARAKAGTAKLIVTEAN